MKRRLWLALFLAGSVLIFTGCMDNDEGVLEGELVSEEAQAGDTKELPEPPSLKVLVGDEAIDVIRGTYSWSVNNEDGTITAIEADTAPPPDLVRAMTPIAVISDSVVELEFEVEPDRYSVRTWEEDYTVSSSRDDVLLTRDGRVIYEVRASWAQGTATYAFVLDIN
ncbi:hypothetical protein GCM10008929_13510 [Alkalibacterium psychrotolerans]